MRLGAIIIAACMVVIAASLGAIGYLMLGLSILESAAVAFPTLCALALIQVMAGRALEHAEASRQIAELSRGTADLARQVSELGRRAIAAEAAASRLGDEVRIATAPLEAEIETLGGLVHQLAESVAAHEELIALYIPAEAEPAHHQAPVQSVTADSAMQAMPTHAPAAPAPEPDRTLSEAAPSGEENTFTHFAHRRRERSRASAIITAIHEGRIDLCLQPIVTLPQRKVRHYEATARVRLGEQILLPEEYRPELQAAGAEQSLDDMMLLRVAQVARRLTGRTRDAAVFYALGVQTVTSAGFFGQFADFLAVNPTLAPSLVLGVPQAGLSEMGPLELEGMAQLARFGVRFCLDGVADPHVEPRQLSGLGIRFAQIAAATLLDEEAGAAAPIHATDLASLFRRFGIDLIVDGVDTEATVVDLLDYDVRYGKGLLFAPPRPVRAELESTDPQNAPVAQQTSGSESRAKPAAEQKPVTALREPLAPGPRRLESEQASQRGGGEHGNARTPQALAQLARNLMRRA